MHPFRRRIVLALGGGGARGLAHIGVLRILERVHLRPSLIVGTSMGSLVGVLAALGMDADTIEARFKAFMASRDFRHSGLSRLQEREATSPLGIIGRRIKERIVLNFSFNRQAIFTVKRLYKGVEGMIPDLTFDDLTIPFIAVATDLSTGKRYEMTNGTLHHAAAASSAIPGFFPPVTIEGHPLTDGGVTDMVPVRTARRRGRGPIVAVDVSQSLPPFQEDEPLIDFVQRTAKITSDTLTVQQLESADVVIRPEVGEFPWYRFDDIDDLIRTGEKEALTVLSRWRWGPFTRLMGLKESESSESEQDPGQD